MFELSLLNETLQVVFGMCGAAVLSDGNVELLTSKLLGKCYFDNEDDLLHVL